MVEMSLAEHSQVTLDLARKESQEHMAGMKEAREAIALKPFRMKAFKLGDPNAPSQTKTIHFIRHGQGFHNLLADMTTAMGVKWEQFTQDPNNPYVKPEILDSPLTEKGRQQAYTTRKQIQQFSNPPQLVVLSPNCRTLQTGCICFQAYANQIPFVAHEMAREENGVHLCDKRRNASLQKQEFPLVDFHLLEESDPIFRNDRRETKLQVAERAYNLMEWISKRSEQHIGVVSHSAWLLTLFNAVFQCDEDLKSWFHTGELRSCKVEIRPRENETTST